HGKAQARLQGPLARSPCCPRVAYAWTGAPTFAKSAANAWGLGSRRRRGLFPPSRPRQLSQLNARKAPLAGSSPRQQRRSGPQGAQEEDAARGHFSGDEAPQLLRETLREARARASRSRAARP